MRTFWAALLLTGWAVFGFGLQVVSPANKKGDTRRELATFRLSMEELRKAARAGKVLEKLSKTDASLKSAAQLAKQGPLSIDVMVSQIDDHPQARTAIESAGLSTKKYVLTMYCFQQSAQALFLKDSSNEKHHIPGASKENVAFVRKNLKEINRLFSQDP